MKSQSRGRAELCVLSSLTHDNKLLAIVFRGFVTLIVNVASF